MQANNDQNWADDGAFWDEAWTDMNRRLDENPPNRKRRVVAWWWYAGAFLALLLVTTPTVVAHVFNDDPGTNTELTPTTPALLQEPAPHPAAAPENDALNTPAIIPATTPEKEVYAGNSVNKEDNTPSQNASAITRETLQMPPLKNLAVTTSAAANETGVTTNEKSSVAEVQQDPISPFTNENPVQENTMHVIPSAIAALSQRAPELLSIPGAIEFPAVAVGKTRRGSLYLEAGALTTVAPNVSGYYAGVGYRIPLGKRLSVPLSIRYRRESLPVKDYPATGSADYAVVNPNAGADSSDLTAIQPGGDRLNFTSLKTEAVELTTGITYAFTPRFRATAGLNVAYMTRAQLYITSLPDWGLMPTEFAAGNSIDLFSGAGEFRNAFDGDFADRGTGVVPDLNPLQFSGHLSVSYELTRRLGISAAGTYLLRQPDRAEVIGLPAARAEVGVRWRLR